MREMDDIRVYVTNNTFIFQNTFKIFISIIRIITKANISIVSISSKELRPHNSMLINKVEAKGCLNADFANWLYENYNMPYFEAEKYIKRVYFYQLCVQYQISLIIKSDSKNKYFILTSGDPYSVYNKNDNLNMIPKQYIGWIEQKFLLLPILFFILNSRLRLYNYSFKKNIKKISSKFVIQVCNFGYGTNPGFPEEMVHDVNIVKLFITPYWSANKYILDSFLTRLKEKDIRYIDYRTFYYSLSHFISFLKFILFIGNSIKHVNLFEFEKRVIYTSFFHYIDEFVNCQNLECKAFISHDDVSMRHFIRTALFRSYNTKCFGIQHSAGNGLMGAVHIAYIYFDAYFIWGKFIKKQFKNFWTGVNIIEVGYRRMDSLLDTLNDEKRKSIIFNINDLCSIDKDKWSKKNILITLPSLDSSVSDFVAMYENSKEMIRYICDFSYEIDKLANIVIRPKRYISDDFKNLVNDANKNIILFDNFDIKTSKLILWSDIVIASNGSGVITECSLLKQKVLSFDYHGGLKPLWEEYGKHMSISKAIEVREVLHLFCNNEPLDVNWDLIWKDLGARRSGILGELIAEQL